MSGKNNIFLNHTLAEYNRKFRNRRDKLLVYTEEEIQSYDKKYGYYKDQEENKTYKVDVLKNRKWWKIGDKYYEIPKFPRWTWFRNLKTSSQVATWTVIAVGLLVGVCATGIVHYIQFGDYRIVEVNDNSSDYVRCESKEINGGLSIHLIPKKDYVFVEGIDNITIGDDNVLLKEDLEYTFDSTNSKVFIIDSCLRANKGRIVISPILNTNN